MNTHLVLLLSMVILSTSVFAAEPISTLVQIKETGKIRLGFRKSDPPMSFLDRNGKAAGYSWRSSRSA